MQTTLSVLAIAGCLSACPLPVQTARQDTAVSAESRCLGNSLAVAVKLHEQSRALFGVKADLRSVIWALFEEHASNIALDEIAAHKAIAFIRALPDHLPLPEAGMDPDGAISLDWMFERTRALSVSINATQRIACAWLDGTDRGHAVTRFDGENIPKLLFERLNELAGVNAIVRTA